MEINNSNWLDHVKTVSKQFIERNVSEELPFFDSFWQVLSTQIHDAVQNGRICHLDLNTHRHSSNILFVKNNALNLLTPVAIAVIAEFLFEAGKKSFSTQELERTISLIASRQGAKPGLVACLVQEVSSLYHSLLHCSASASEATISASAPQYMIWTEGKKAVTTSIEKYQKQKDRFLFWVDLDDIKTAVSKKPDSKASHKAFELLKYLVESIGQYCSAESINIHVFDDGFHDENLIANKIEQQITRLHKLSGGQFRQHLFTNRSKGYGLKESFKDIYFLFERLT